MNIELVKQLRVIANRMRNLRLAIRWQSTDDAREKLEKLKKELNKRKKALDEKKERDKNFDSGRKPTSEYEKEYLETLGRYEFLKRCFEEKDRFTEDNDNTLEDFVKYLFEGIVSPTGVLYQFEMNEDKFEIERDSMPILNKWEAYNYGEHITDPIQNIPKRYKEVAEQTQTLKGDSPKDDSPSILFPEDEGPREEIMIQ